MKNLSSLLQLLNLTLNLVDKINLNHDSLNNKCINLDWILSNHKRLKYECNLVLNNRHKLFNGNKCMDDRLFNNKIFNSNNLIRDLCRNNNNKNSSSSSNNNNNNNNNCSSSSSSSNSNS